MDVIPLNRMLSCKNVADPELFSSTMITALDDIVALLENHCGPSSQFSMLVDATNPMKEPIFTKDGIAILSAVQAFNPIAQLLHKEIGYIGQAVDRQVGDGTTSAMIQVAEALRTLLLWNKYELNGELSRIPYTKLKQCYVELCNDIRHITDRFTLSVDEVARKYSIPEKEAVKFIAFLQAMTSSHGDTELSLAVAEVFSNLTKESWKNISYHREICETEHRVQCVIETDQYQLMARPLSPLMLTEDLGQGYRREHGYLIVSSGPTTSTEDTYTQIETILTNCAIDTPVTILVSSDIDPHVENRLQVLCNKFAVLKIGIFYHDSKHPRLNDLAGLSVVGGHWPTFATDKLVCFDKVKVEFYNHQMHINGIYPSDTVTDDNIHGDYNRLGSPLRMFLDQMDLIIQKIEQETPTSAVITEKNRITRLYNRVKHTKLHYIKIGGTIYDNVTTQDIVTDCLKAARSSLTYGFTPAANFALMLALRDLVVKYWQPQEHTEKLNWWEAFKNECCGERFAVSDMHSWFVDKVCKATTTPSSKQYLMGLLALALYYPTASVFDMALCDPDHHLNWVDDTISECVNPEWDTDLFITAEAQTDGFEPINMYDVFGYLMRTGITKDTKYFPIQPTDLYRVVLERFGEVALKLVKTSETIAHGGMIMED
jgi:hypothetical protein